MSSSVYPSKQKDLRQSRGKKAELYAVQWLERQGFQIITRNWRPLLWEGAGEVDIVAQAPRGKDRSNDIWLFEVKCRTRTGLGAPLCTPRQLRRLYRARMAAHACFRGWRLHIALLWIDPHSQEVEFLENP